MATKSRIVRVTALYEAWRTALDAHQKYDTQKTDDAEQHAYDELVDFVESHGLNNTSWDPR